VGSVPEEFLRNRGLSRFETVCPPCGGWGLKWYSSGATWRGGMGTASSAQDVCNFCWGSGNSSKPWLNLKTLQEDIELEISRRAHMLLADAAGTNIGAMQPAIYELVLELEKFSRGRKPRAAFFVDLCLSLIKILKR